MQNNNNVVMSVASIIKLYAGPAVIVGSVLTWLIWVVAGKQYLVQKDQIIAPMLALFALTALVWGIMVVVRNLAVILGKTSIRYFEDFKTEVPDDDRFERTARVFNNLLQVPPLFYVICILMLVTNQVDTAQITLAWMYVVIRAVHALVYLTINLVPYRFATWIASCVVLGVIWFRFGLQVCAGG